MRLGPGEGRALALAGIVLLALGMRSATSAFSPVFTRVDAELALGSVVLGVVGALPPFAFALSGALTPWLARRVGVERALLAAIAAIVLGQAVRGLAGEVVGIVAATALAMLGIGIANVLLPSIVKRYFAGRVGVVTAIATTLFAIGAASPAFFAVPLSDALGWRLVLASWGATVALAAIPWILLARRRTEPGAGLAGLAAPDEGRVRVARSPIAWALMLVLFASAMIGYSGSAWLPLLLVDRAGVGDAAAGAYLGILLAIGIPAALLVPLAASRPRPAAALVALAAVFGTAGWTGLLVAPAAAPAVWATLIGCGALTFPLVLVQLAVRAATPRVAVRLSAFVQTGAYIATGTAVLALGVLHDATADWAAPLVVLVVVALLPLAVLPIVARPDRVGAPS